MDTFLWELEMLQVDARRTELLVFMCERGLEAYEALLKLPMKKIIRQYKEEYEVAARAINQAGKSITCIDRGIASHYRPCELKSKELALLMRAIRDLQSNYRDYEDDVVVADDEEAHVKNDEEDDYESKHTEEPVATVADHTPDQEEEPVDN
ncbi:THO complex subunit 7 [Aphanomyces cochlioides]|nr:THO complex subunit 7 [Aphanomyces cochlioides]KAG9397917.1 THO complex subunit 7 [Aphanomyces cochlioides]KAG9397918.1 THO complex subunit 7 [Aphanomyces cochlioides]KAG9400294.1 THO complex subunit 7 [Aphanomyces cochlioides]